MLFLAKRRNGSAWEESAESSLRMLKQKRTGYDAPHGSPDFSSDWHSWDESWESNNLWEPAWQKGDWGWQHAESKGRGKDKKRDKNTEKTMKKQQSKAAPPQVSTSFPLQQAACAPADLPADLSFSGVVNAFEPKSGNLLIDCPSVSQIFGKPPFIRPEDNGMNARVGSMVVFKLMPGEVPVVSDFAINGFDSEVGLRPDPVHSDDCEMAGFLNAKGKDASGEKVQKGSFGGKSPGNKGKDQRANWKGGSKGPKGRGKASPVRPWRT